MTTNDPARCTIDAALRAAGTAAPLSPARATSLYARVLLIARTEGLALSSRDRGEAARAALADARRIVDERA